MKRTLFLRYLLIVMAFCLICVIYLGRLFYIQISGRQSTYTDSTETRTVTVQAVRGEIYDRNGVPLVTNHYTYDMTLSYSAFSHLPVHRANGVCLELLKALEACDCTEKHTERLFPYDGAYPYYTLSEETAAGDSLTYYRLQRVLADLKMKSTAKVRDVINHYVDAYRLLETDNSGKRLYNDDEVDRLIRLRYELDAVRFASAGVYGFADDVSMELMTYIKEKGLDAVTFSVSVERVYQYPGYASHILGTVGPIYSEEWAYYNEQGYQMNAIVGKSGCELAFEQYLHGTDGVMIIEVDSAGNIVRTEVRNAPVAGSDVWLTIDINLQIAAEDGLKENTEYVVNRSGGVTERGAGCNAGAAVAMNPETFEVLAIASYPSFNLATYHADYDLLNADEAKPLLNRALNGSYAPGSTFKLGMAVTALTEGVIDTSSTIRCDGKYPSPGASGAIGCSTYGTSHSGAIDVIRAIAVSCNSFFCELGNRLGIEKMEDYMGRFGFGRSTGIELGGTTGIIAGPTYRQSIHGAVWTNGMTWQAAIGQSDNQASPLQLACYVSTLANGGTRYSAHLLKSLYSFGSDTPSFTYTQTEETVLDTVSFSAGVQATVFAGMREVVASNDVIGRFINSSTVPVTVGGKTGTAQNSSQCDNSLFVCCAPYNAPEIVISVVLEQGYTGGYSSLTAARILQAYYRNTEEEAAG